MKDGTGFQEILKVLMIDSGMNQSELARKSKLSAASVSNYVNGVNRPKPKSLELLIDALFPEGKRNSEMAKLLRKYAKTPAPYPRARYWY